MTATQNQLQELHTRFAMARTPEAIFGTLAAPQAASLRASFREFARAIHPDHNPDDKPLAERAFALLIRWRDQALERIARGTYGTLARDPSILRTPRGTYRIHEPAVVADYADIYPAESDAAGGLQFKITRHPWDNPLALNEARALQALQHSPGTRYFPRLIEAFLAQEGTSRRQAVVYATGCATHTLAGIRRAYPTGIDPRDAAWMFNRLLEALYHTHNAGIVHGALTPGNICINIEDHGLVLTEWGYSVTIGETMSAISAPFESWYPPEVFAKAPVSTALDIYMAARCLEFLLAGNAALFAPFLRACLLPPANRRPSDAGALREDFGNLLLSLFGKPAFSPFTMPSNF